MRKLYLMTIISLFVFFPAIQGQAVTIDFTYDVPGDGSGKISPYIDDDPSLQYFVETFDEPGSNGNIYTADNGGSITVDAGGGFNTLDPTKLDVVGGFGVRQGTQNGLAATPADDTTFFAFGPGPDGSLPASVKVENSDFNAFEPGLLVRYLGLYYGSIDNYNNISFYSGNSLLETDSGLLSDGILEGSEILSSQDGTSGDRFGEGSNVYVNLFFENDEIFTAFEYSTTGVAFEMDNIVAGVGAAPVPEPSTLILLGGGLLGLGFYARRKKK